MNHSSDKCQRALVHALIPVNPSIRPKRASSPACARPARPRARPSTATRLPSCAQNFFPISRELSSISRISLVRALIPVQPLHPPQKGLQRGPYSPGRRDARGLRQPPVCPVAPKISCTNLTHSLVISRVTLLHLPCLSTPSTAPKMLLTSIPFETGTLPANATTVSWPSRLPLHAIRNTQFSAQPAPSPLQEPGPPYKLYPSPQDQGGSGPSLHLNKRILSDRTTTVARP